MLKVAIIGPESSGKSTLCKALAAHYNTVWTEEFARAYLHTHGVTYNFEDLLTIAKGQLLLEDNLIAGTQASVVFFDTNLYVMEVWSEYVFGQCNHFILDAIARYEYDLYLLCVPDLPWEEDVLREYPDPAQRNEIYQYYKTFMAFQHVPFCTIGGKYATRLADACGAIDKMLA